MNGVGLAGRMAGWPSGAVLLIIGAMRPGGLPAQTFAIGPQVVFGDYREVSADLAYRGAGAGAVVAVARGKVGLEVALAWLRYEPADDGAAVDAFDAQQFDGWLSYDVTRSVSAELGLTNRVVDPDFAAQSAGAVRVGARMSNAIGPGVRLSLRGHYLAGAQFSGGGTAPFGVEVGLGVVGEFLRRRMRVTADYEFQYLDRNTDDGSGQASVPIQQALMRLGAAVAF
jgi:hypothetical protein